MRNLYFRNNALNSAFHLTRFGLVFLSVLSACGAWAQSGSGKRMSDPVNFYFPGYDLNGDGKLDRTEWSGRGNFDLLDSNNDQGIDRRELAVLYADFGVGWKPEYAAGPANPVVIDERVTQDQVEIESIGKASYCAVSRSRQCPDGDSAAFNRGLLPTGLTPTFPSGVACPAVDESFALSYADKTGKGAHGGIDIPVATGTPIIATADGIVVAKVDNLYQLRGLTVTLRHSPQDTGLPFWVYTEYGHLREMPPLAIGQRVRKGEIIGETGNTGVRPGSPSVQTLRRPGIHYAVYYAQSPMFALFQDYVVPKDPRWMDPMALFLRDGPHDSHLLAKLPLDQKNVEIAVMLSDGRTVPEATRLVWPYVCRIAR